VLEALLRAFSAATVLAVGRTAQASLQELDRAVVALRHPSMGGATAFRKQLREAVRQR